ncbi:MAG: ABC transporter permease [Chitinophagaceae bacterium]
MFKSNIKIAWRNLIKNRLFTFLNLTGLATGLAAVLFIFLWVKDERGMDRFHANDKRLYQLLGSIKLANGTFTQDYTPALLAPSIAKDMPEVEMATGVMPAWGGKGVISYDDKHLKAATTYIDSNFFTVFSYPLVAGNAATMFSGNHYTMISDEMAVKLFGSSEKSLGKSVEWKDEPAQYTIVAVFKKPPVNSTMKFDVLLNIALRGGRSREEWEDWSNSNPSTYVVLKTGTDIDQFNKKIYGYMQTKSDHAVLSLQAAKYSDRYLYNKYENGKLVGGRIEYVRLFSLVALFILVIACINFMNLSTAKAARRAKEIGIKKVAGAGRATLIIQYISESMLMVFLSVAVAIALVLLLLPLFNSVTGKSLSIQWNTEFISSLLGITVLTGLIAGSYPAFYLSGFRPVTVLKGKLPASLAELWIRKGLVVFQFTLSVIFIIAVITIYKQMNLVQTINLGYAKDNIISFRNEGALPKSIDPFMNDLKNLPGVMSVSTLGGNMSGEKSGSTERVTWEGKKAGDSIYIMNLDADYGILEMLDIKMAAGRTFSREIGNDSASMIVNETAVAAMGMKDPIGKTVTLWGVTYRIIGVAKDFHFESLYEKVRPCLIRYGQNNYNIFVKINHIKQKEALEAIQKLYRAYNPIFPFSFTFLDEDYQAMYTAEQKVAALSKFFAALAILISCLGLFGLAAFTAEKRKKEIGIRKVIGASVGSVVMLLSKDFLRLILLAVVIAFPVAWWAVNQWLNNFAYRVPLNASIFVLAAISIVGITLLTISAQSIKAAIANPVKALRTE